MFFALHQLCEGLDDNDSMFDPLDTISISTTMSVDGCRVKIPPEVKKISVNRDSGESVLHKAARLGYRVSADLNCVHFEIVHV